MSGDVVGEAAPSCVAALPRGGGCGLGNGKLTVAATPASRASAADPGAADRPKL